MSRELLSAALEQAERAEPDVRAAALFHIARVMNAFDHAEAEREIDEALALTAALPEPDREVLMAQAVPLIATVLPARALALAPTITYNTPRTVLEKALSDMISHGHVAEAIDYLSDPDVAAEYPFDVAQQVIGRATDDEVRLRLLRSAMAALRRQLQLGDGRSFFHGRATSIVNTGCRLLPADEAAAIVRDVAHWILAQPDESIHAGHQDVRFSSTQAHRLFQILGPLQRLAPDLAQSAIDAHPQLKAAAARYPYGQESIEARLRPAGWKPPLTSPPMPPPSIAVGERLMAVSQAIATEFRDAFDLALRTYFSDTDSSQANDAPKECWPSAGEFRMLMYQAGKHEGADAVRYLDRIPDDALRLFAQIEFAAALATLPQAGGFTIMPGPYGFRRSWEMSRQTRATAPATPSPAMRRSAPVRKPDLPPSFEARIAPSRRATGTGPAGGSGPDYWVIEGAPLLPVIARLYGISDRRIDLAPALAAQSYDFALVLPSPVSRETMTRLMRESIETTFQVTREQRPMDVEILRAPGGIRTRAAADGMFGGVGVGSMSYVEHTHDDPGRAADHFQLMDIMDLHMVPPDVAPTPEDALRDMRNAWSAISRGSGSGGIGINGIDDSMTMEELCGLLERGLDRPVIDETQLPGRYAIRMHTEAVDTRDFARALCDKLGLTMTSDQRDVPMLIVRPR